MDDLPPVTGPSPLVIDRLGAGVCLPAASRRRGLIRARTITFFLGQGVPEGIIIQQKVVCRSGRYSGDNYATPADGFETAAKSS